MVRHFADDLQGVRLQLPGGEDVGEGLGGHGAGQLNAVERGEGDGPHEGPFQLPDVGGDLPGDVLQGVLGDPQAPLLGVHLQDGDPGFQVGGWMSVIKPHSKRLRRRASRVRMSLGGRSEERMICLWAS